MLRKPTRMTWIVAYQELDFRPYFPRNRRHSIANPIHQYTHQSDNALATTWRIVNYRTKRPNAYKRSPSENDREVTYSPEVGVLPVWLTMHFRRYSIDDELLPASEAEVAPDISKILCNSTGRFTFSTKPQLSIMYRLR